MINGILKKLHDSVAVTNYVPAERILPLVQMQGDEVPAILVDLEGVRVNESKSTTSQVDDNDVAVVVVSESAKEAYQIASACREVLDGFGGESDGVQIGECRFVNWSTDEADGGRLFVLSSAYLVATLRDGATAIVSGTIDSGGGGGTTLVVRESDGSPSVEANRIIVPTDSMVVNGQEVTLNFAKSSEITALQLVDGVLSGSITAETTARTTADATLQTNIDNEATARTDADATLQNNIDNEASLRNTADNNLQSTIDNLTIEQVDNTGILEQLAEQLADLNGLGVSDFPNGLVGDFNQDGVVGSADLILFLGYFEDTLSSAERSARVSAYVGNTIGAIDPIRSINGETADRDGDVNLTTTEIGEGNKLFFTDARADARIAAALISDLADIPDGIGTAGQVLVVNDDRTGYEFATRLAPSALGGYVRTIGGELEPDSEGDITLTTEFVSEVSNLYFTNARADARIAAAVIGDLSDIPDAIGTTGQVLSVNADRTGYEFTNKTAAYVNPYELRTVRVGDAFLLGGASVQDFTGTTPTQIALNTGVAAVNANSTTSELNGITIDDGGVYRFSFSAEFTSTGQRATPQAFFYINNAKQLGTSHGYIRRSTGVDHNSLNLTRVFNLSDGDFVEVRVGDTSTANAAINCTFGVLDIEKLT